MGNQFFASDYSFTIHEHVVTYRSQVCGSMLQLVAQSMEEHIPIFICELSRFN